MQLIHRVALLLQAAVLTGCTSSSILTSKPDSFPFGTSVTSYDEFLDHYRGETVTLVRGDTTSLSGKLISASTDSLVCISNVTGSRVCISSKDIARIEARGSHLRPMLLGTGCGLLVGLPIAVMMSGGFESGGSHSNQTDFSTIAAGLGWGGLMGFVTGAFFSTTSIYYCNEQAVRR